MSPCTWQQASSPLLRTCASLSLARMVPAVIADARLTLLLAPETPDTPLITLLAPLPDLPPAVNPLSAVPAMLAEPTLPRETPANEALAPASGDDALSGWLGSSVFWTVTVSSFSLELRVVARQAQTGGYQMHGIVALAAATAA